MGLGRTHFPTLICRQSLFLSLLVLCGCTKPPELPPLFGAATSNHNRVALDDGLSVADIRELFDAVNQNKKLDPLIPYLQAPSEEALASLAKLFSKYLYEEANSPTGLINLLAGRIETRAFGKAFDKARAAVIRPGYRERGEAVIHALGRQEFPSLLSRDIGWIEPDWSDSLSFSVKDAQTFMTGAPTSSPNADWDGKGWVKDFNRLISNPEFKKSFARLTETLEENDIGTPIVKAARLLRRTTQSKAFEGFGLGLGKMLKTPALEDEPNGQSQLELLLQFAKTADGPTEGIFRTLEERIRSEPDLIRELSSHVQPIVPGAIAGYLYDRLLHGPGSEKNFGKPFWKGLAQGNPDEGLNPQSIEFFTAARTAVEKFAGRLKERSAPDHFLANLPRILTAYAITKWAQRWRSLS